MAFEYTISDHTGQRTFDVEEMLNKIVAEVLPDVDVEPCFVERFVDDDDEQALMVTLCYRNANDMVSAKALNILTFRVRQCLVDQGIRDYPYFQHALTEGQKVSA